MVAFVQALPAFRGECSVVHYASRIAVRTAMAARKRRLIRQNRAEAIGQRSRRRATTPRRPAKTRGPFAGANSCARCSTSFPRRKPTRSRCASRSATRCKRSPTPPALRSTPSQPTSTCQRSPSPPHRKGPGLRRADWGRNMNHPVDVHPEELLDREQLGQLSADEQRRLDAHATQCAACALVRSATVDFASERAPADRRRCHGRALDRRSHGKALASTPPASGTYSHQRRKRSAWAVAAVVMFAATGATASFWSVRHVFIQRLLVNPAPAAPTIASETVGRTAAPKPATSEPRRGSDPGRARRGTGSAGRFAKRPQRRTAQGRGRESSAQRGRHSRRRQRSATPRRFGAGDEALPPAPTAIPR